MGDTSLERALARLESAVLLGERCPFSDQIPGGSHSFGQLAREGKILVEVYMHNFRRVTILTGPHAGLHTSDAPPDHNGRPRKPYLTVSKDGTRRNGRIIDTGFKKRTAPTIKDYSRGA